MLIIPRKTNLSRQYHALKFIVVTFINICVELQEKQNDAFITYQHDSTSSSLRSSSGYLWYSRVSPDIKGEITGNYKTLTGVCMCVYLLCTNSNLNNNSVCCVCTFKSHAFIQVVRILQFPGTFDQVVVNAVMYIE